MNTLKAEKRSMDVKAKKLRREGFVTGNVFGREIEESIPIKMERTAVERLFKTCNKGSQIMLDVDGTSYNVLIKDVAYNSMASRFDEVDFQALVSNEKVHSVAEIVIVNHDKVISGVLEEKLEEVSYKAYPADLVDKIEVDVSGMKAGDDIRVKDLAIAKNPKIDLSTDPEAEVVVITVPRNAVPDDSAAEEEAEAAE